MFDVITIGTASRDAFLRSPDFKIISSSEFVAGEGLCLPAGAKIDVADIIFSTGGGATNSAVTFSRQLYRTASVCKIGPDVSGKEVVANLQAENVDTRFVIQDGNFKTAYSILLLAPGGERTVLVFRGASEHLESPDMNLLGLETKWFYIAGSLSMDLLGEILDRAKKTKTLVAMNPSASQIKLGLSGFGEMLKRVSVLILNREEGALLTGIDYSQENEIFSRLDEYVPGIVVMTEGPKGVLVSDGRTVYRAGIYPERALVDRTGSGDAFGSGFVAGLINRPVTGDTIAAAIKLASANATSVVEAIGAKTGILSRQDFEKDPRWEHLDVSAKSLR